MRSGGRRVGKIWAPERSAARTTGLKSDESKKKGATSAAVEATLEEEQGHNHWQGHNPQQRMKHKYHRQSSLIDAGHTPYSQTHMLMP